MDEKAESAEMGIGVHKSKLVGVSMLLLSLLLSASVASLIYVAVSNGNPSYETTRQKNSDVDVKAEVTVKSESREVKDRIEYSTGGHTMYNYGSDGTFEFDDFRKGIHLVQHEEDGVCYIIPVGANQSVGIAAQEFLEEWNGKELEVAETEVDVQIYDGKLTDVSFLPQKVQDECTSGYQWMAIIQKESSSGEVSRGKRDSAYPYWHDHYYYWRCTVNGQSGWCWVLYIHYSTDCTASTCHTIFLK